MLMHAVCVTSLQVLFLPPAVILFSKQIRRVRASKSLISSHTGYFQRVMVTHNGRALLCKSVWYHERHVPFRRASGTSLSVVVIYS
ncbi:hypothetical protein DER46DRAFT_603826 [Fusarium sp. MPI-SDFR-AT-0072]|nr:hypothetical protein DER46DRAFT_603826 [Fusarium sp. MPI-SDFR-AT-0072]